MPTYAEFKQERIARFMVDLASYGIDLEEDQSITVREMLNDLLMSAQVYANIDFPRQSKAKYKLVANESVIIGYHPIKGAWHHIAQVVTPKGKTMYYTDGVPEDVDGGQE